MKRQSSPPRRRTAHSLASGGNTMGRWAAVVATASGFAIAFSPAARGAVSTWNGGTGKWSDNNWTGGVPNSQTTDAVIDSNPAVSSVVTLTPGNTINNLTVDGGDTLLLNPTNPASLSTYGNWTINGIVGSATARYGGGFFNGAPVVSGSGTLYASGMGVAGLGFLTFGPDLNVHASSGNWSGGYLFQGNFIVDAVGDQDGFFLGMSFFTSTNTGHVQVNAGTYFDAYAFNNASGAILDLNHKQARFTGALTNAGAINLTDTLLEVRNATLSDLEHIHFVGGTNELHIEGAVDNTNHVFQVSGGTAVISALNGYAGTMTGGTILATAGGSFQLGGGTLRDVTLQGDVRFYSSNPQVRIEGSLTLNNVDLAPPVNPFGGGQLYFTGTSAHHLAGIGSFTFVGSTSGIWTDSAVTIDPGILIQGGGGGRVQGAVNFGTIRATPGNDYLLLFGVTNAATIIIPAGATAETNAIMQSGTAAITQVNGMIYGGGPISITGGTLSGTGSIQVDVAHTSGNVILAAIVSPGAGGISAAAAAASAHSATPTLTAGSGDIGTLSAVADSVVFQPGSHYEVDLAGDSAADLLQITGNLDLSAADDYLDVSAMTPLTGTTYVIATYTGTLTGTFDHVTVPAGYRVSYETPGQIQVVVPEPGAFAAIAAAGLASCRFRKRRPRRPPES